MSELHSKDLQQFEAGCYNIALIKRNIYIYVNYSWLLTPIELNKSIFNFKVMQPCCAAY